MLKIKLARIGRSNQPFFRIVVMEAKSKLNGKVIAKIGSYNPLTNPSSVKLDKKSYEEWLTKGAQPTLTVARLAKTIK